MNSSRRNGIVLISLFIALIFGVPAVQMALEMRRGERVQFTDLFRYAPSEKNLREFEAALESKSLFQQTLRPEMQRFLFKALRDPGSKGMMGRNGWIFYRPGVRYLIEPNRLESDEKGSATVQTPGKTDEFREEVGDIGIQGHDEDVIPEAKFDVGSELDVGPEFPQIDMGSGVELADVFPVRISRANPEGFVAGGSSSSFGGAFIDFIFYWLFNLARVLLHRIGLPVGGSDRQQGKEKKQVDPAQSRHDGVLSCRVERSRYVRGL